MQSDQTIGYVIVIGILLLAMILFALWFTKHQNKDELTGLPTLKRFKWKAKKLLYRNQGNHKYALIKLDVKNFKLINRIYDIEVGDNVIKNIALALHYVTRDKSALCAKVGVDDFLCLLPYESEEELSEVRKQFQEKFRQLMGGEFNTTVTFPMGQYLFTESDYIRLDIDGIVEKVNFAHSAAKQRNDNILDYVEDIEEEALAERKIEDRTPMAFENEEFTLYLQPKYRVSDGTLCGAEALVRWKIEEEYFMHPTDFIPVLEKTGFIIKLDLYMFECAAKKMREMLDQGEELFPVSVNFSRHHLSNQQFVQQICVLADRYQIPHQFLEIELTESAIISNTEGIIQLIEELHANGFRIAMDDFGTGISSLSQLSALKVDVVKIDKSFFDQVQDMERARVVISNVLHMARQLGAETVAEGIETQDQVDLLRELKCDIIQGFFYSKPVPSDDFCAVKKVYETIPSVQNNSSEIE